MTTVLEIANFEGKLDFKASWKRPNTAGCISHPANAHRVRLGGRLARWKRVLPAQSPHFAPASEMLERLRRRDAKYVSTKGALLIRVRLAGVSRREKIAYAILLRGTLFSP